MMRIITGRARGTKLVTLEGNNTRPTSERVKEAVFSMIQFDIEGRNVLDLFAGSGQMGLEAISRGAASATFVDNSKAAIGVIKQNVTKTHFENESEMILSSAEDYLKRVKGRKKFDLVFIDPPYATGVQAKMLELLLAYDLIKTTSTIVCESGEEDIFKDTPELADKFEIIKKAKYSISYVTILNIK
jgi:16S rRNA (guanine(966)-N(2))-methyltransferase RsmD